MPAPADLVHEASTTTGTGNLTLSEINGKRRFSSPFGTGGSNVFDYFVSHRGAVEWERGTGSMSDANTLVRDTVIASSNSNSAVNFSAGLKDVTNDIPAANQVYNENSTVTDGHAVLFDGTTGRKLKSAGAAPYVAGGTDVPVADGGTGASTAQAARASLQAASFNAGADLGLLTNPFFEISQENGTSSGAAASAYYAADQWYALESSSAVLAVAQTALPYSSTATLRRVPNAMRATASTASGALGAAEFVAPCVQNFEGTFWKSLGWGTADARAIDIVIIAQASVTGTYAVAVRNAANTRSYVTTISLTANTPTLCMVTIPGDTSGTWPTTNVLGGSVAIGAATGSDRLATSLNTWDTANDLSHSSCTNFANSGTTNFFEVAYCQVFQAGVIPYTAASEFTGEGLQLLLNMRRPYGDELKRCQRYYEKVPAQRIHGTMFSATQILANAHYLVEKRTAPTITLLAAAGSNFHNGAAGLGGTMTVAASTNGIAGSYIQFDSASGGTTGNAVVGASSTDIIAVNARM